MEPFDLDAFKGGALANECSARTTQNMTEFRARTTLGGSSVHFPGRRPDGLGRHVLRAPLDALDCVQDDKEADAEASSVSELLGANEKGVTPLDEPAMHLTD